MELRAIPSTSASRICLDFGSIGMEGGRRIREEGHEVKYFTGWI
jgi:hypothetical protein